LQSSPLNFSFTKSSFTTLRFSRIAVSNIPEILYSYSDEMEILFDVIHPFNANRAFGAHSGRIHA